MNPLKNEIIRYDEVAIESLLFLVTTVTTLVKQKIKWVNIRMSIIQTILLASETVRNQKLELCKGPNTPTERTVK